MGTSWVIVLVAVLMLLGVGIGAIITMLAFRLGAQAAKGLPLTLKDHPTGTTVLSPEKEAEEYERLVREREAVEIQ